MWRHAVRISSAFITGWYVPPIPEMSCSCSTHYDCLMAFVLHCWVSLLPVVYNVTLSRPFAAIVVNVSKFRLLCCGIVAWASCYDDISHVDILSDVCFEKYTRNVEKNASKVQYSLSFVIALYCCADGKYPLAIGLVTVLISLTLKNCVGFVSLSYYQYSISFDRQISILQLIYCDHYSFKNLKQKKTNPFNHFSPSKCKLSSLLMPTHDS